MGVGKLASDPEFSGNDTNKDSAFSYEEVISEKLADSNTADTNGDDVLTIIEVKKLLQ